MLIKLEHIECNLCRSNKYRILYRKPDNCRWINQFEFPIVQCKSCNLVYVNPRPTLESMSYYYSNAYHTNRDTEKHIRRYQNQSDLLPALDNEKILDIGCAQGDFLMYLKKLYPNVQAYGCDYYSDRVKSSEINFCNKLLHQCKYESNYFDFVTAWAVFEHLHDPDLYFKEVYRILKPGGRFIFLVTNSESLWSRRGFREDIPRHLYHFSRKSLQKYALKNNFSFKKLLYNNKIFDGRGFGTFRFLLGRLAGVSWERLYFNELNLAQLLFLKAGSFIDKILFSIDWEQKMGRSGIIVVEFEK